MWMATKNDIGLDLASVHCKEHPFCFHSFDFLCIHVADQCDFGVEGVYKGALLGVWISKEETRMRGKRCTLHTCCTRFDLDVTNYRQVQVNVDVDDDWLFRRRRRNWARRSTTRNNFFVGCKIG